MLRNIGHCGVAKDAPSVHALQSRKSHEERLREGHGSEIWRFCKKKEVLYLLAQDLAGSWALANKVVYISFRTHLL
jgi:hypothetical protein